MHVSLELVKQREQPQDPRFQPEASRRRHEERRREAALRRVSSLGAQLLVPLAPLFSLPGLTEKWYVTKTADGSIVETQPDPPFIIAAGAVTLAFAIIANIAILFRLIETHPRWFSLGTIGFLTIHVAVNLVALIVFVKDPSQPAGYVLSTAFWLTVASSCVAAVSTVLLLVDGILTGWYSRGGTGVTNQQRSLVLTWDFFVALILIGSVAYRYLIAGATYLDTIYFCIQSALTVGFGDVTLNTTGAIVFSIFWNVFGILTFALLVTFTNATALEAIQEQYKSQERLILERLRRRVPAKASPSPGLGSLLVAILSFGLIHSRGRQEADQEAEEAEESSERDGSGPADDKVSQRYETAIEELRAEKNREFRSQLAVSLGLFLVFWLVGAAVFSTLEGWSYGISFYFVFVMASTIGYGDYSPQTQSGRAFFCVWAIAGAGILTVLFSVLADAYSARFKETFQRSFVSRAFIRVFQPEHAAELKRADLAALPGTGKALDSKSTLSLPALHDDHDAGPAVGQAELDHPHDVVKLLKDVGRHIDYLIMADGEDKDEHVDHVARRVMERERFSRINREHVENDSSMKEFLYLRHLRDKLAALERRMASSSRGDDKSIPAPEVLSRDHDAKALPPGEA